MIHDIPQGTDAWLQVRLGKVTASRISDMLARTKSGWGASRGNYAAQLVVERLTGQRQDSYTNAAMLWGTQTEPLARNAYAQHMLAAVDEIGFVDHPTIEMSGCSPDGLVGGDGLVEFKCPESKTHIETLLGGAIPDKYRLQMLFQMACTERAYCDFVSFDPRLPESMRLFVQRLPRDDDAIAEIEREVVAFLGEVERTVAELRARYERELEAA